MEVVALASGSKGNCWYVEVGGIYAFSEIEHVGH